MTPPPADRFVEVPAQRVTRWVERFVESHGPAEVAPSATGFSLVAADGSTARLALLVEVTLAPGGAWRSAAGLAAAALAVPPLLVVAVRRGGWAVGVVAGGRERAGKAGRSYVQGRTAAGGSSQSRYQRRRGNQSAKLAENAATSVRRYLADPDVMAGVVAVVPAGDRELCRGVLAEAGVDLPLLDLLDVGDPRRVTIADIAQRVQAVRVHVRNADPVSPVAAAGC